MAANSPGGTRSVSLPANGDPYEEIYKLKDCWFGLLKEKWLNPAGLPGAGFAMTCAYLDVARDFHDTLGDYYHPQSYAHYGADPSQPSWQSVTWNFGRDFVGRWPDLEVVQDDEKGTLMLKPKDAHPSLKGGFQVTLGAAEGAGDQTVPMKSADHQLLRGKLKGIFRQTGYEHQGSYDSNIVLWSTLYSIVRILQTVRWETGDD